LLAVVLILFVVPYFVQPAVGSRDEQAFQKYGKGIREFQSDDNRKGDDKKEVSQADPPAQPLHYASEKNRVSGEDREKSILFYFDPNLISGEDWHRLGLPDKLVMTISHYIQKGGSFHRAGDLKKLYGLKSEDYERLLPYVRIGESAQHKWGDHPMQWPRVRKESQLFTTNNGHGPESGTRDAVKPYPYTFSGKKMVDLDINQADSSAWCQLPGIGIKLASRIIRFREKLGGFYEVDQLRETFGLPDSTFQKIRPWLHVSQEALQKIDLNAAVQETLQAHPYIRWKLARGIVQYREQHGQFKSVGELQQLAQMDMKGFKKLEPYLEVK